MDTGKNTKKNIDYRQLSRREFIGKSSLLLAGATLCTNSSGISRLMPLEPEPIIDIHQHTDYYKRNNDLLLPHQQALGVSKTILLPAGRLVNSPTTHNGFSNGLQADITGNEIAFAFAEKHAPDFLFGANEVPDLPDAIETIEKYLKLGAVVIGELKFGIECDSQEMQKIYQLALQYDVPVLMHWQFDLYNYGLERFHTMLEKYPGVNFIGHAQGWWASTDKAFTDQSIKYPKGKITPGGLTDRLLSDYPNMFGDMSAGSGLNFLTRDEAHAREFLARHQDKLLFGSDCADTDGHGSDCIGAQLIAAIRKLSPTKKVERKLLYENAMKLFRL